MSRPSFLDRAYESLIPIIAPVTNSNPRQLKPGETIRLLNSTPLGQVMTEKKLRQHRERGGMRIGDGKTIDLLRYAAWLAQQPRSTAGLEAATNPKPLLARADYADKKERERERNAGKSRSGRDVGADLEEARAKIDWERRNAAAKSFRKFCETYLKGDFALDWSEMHLEVISTLEACTANGGWFAMAMPRGSGKTTLTMAAALWVVLTGRVPFVVVLAATATKAVDLLDRMKREFETNDLLAADWPEICVPIRALEGLPNRCKGQLYFGKRTYVEYAKSAVVLPTVPNSVAAGAVIRTGGLLGSAVRGPLYKHPDGRSLRPSLAICDDPQTDASAGSKLQTRKRLMCLTQAVTGMAGPGKKMSIIVPCTVIEQGDMADQLLDREKYPDYQGVKFPLLGSFPKRIELWKEYYELLTRGKRSGKGPAEANKFYKARRKLMDEGALATWPARYIEDELSAVQHAMNIWLRDPEYFSREMQNAPPAPMADLVEDWYLSVDEIAERINGIKQAVIPNWANQLCAYIDMQKRMLFWSLAAVGDGFTIGVPDYGTYPEQPRKYFSYRDAPIVLKPKKGQGHDAVLQAALAELITQLFARVWKREDGMEMKLDRCLIDTGYENRLVHQVCRSSPHRASLYPAKGVGIPAKKRPISAYAKKPGETIGEEWILTPAPAHASRLLQYDTNYWKTFAHKRLATGYGNPGNGSCTINGPKGTTHRLLAEHWRAEKPTKVTADGRDVYEWQELPSKPDNHWLDTFVGSLVAASTLGAKLGIVSPAGTKKSTKKKPPQDRIRYLNF